MESNPYLPLIRRYFAPQKGRVCVLFLLLSAGIAIQVGMPQILSYYVDTASAPSSYHLLILSACLFIGLVIVNQIVQIFDIYIGERVAWLATNTIRQEVILHCLKMDMSFHKAYSPGEMIERVDGDVTALANFFSRFALKILGNGLLVIGIIIVLFFTNIWLGLCFTAFAGLSLWLLNRIREFATPYWIQARQASADLFSFLGDSLAGIEDIRANGATHHVMSRFMKVTVELLHKERGAYVRGRSLWPFTIAVFAVGYAMIFLLGVQLLHLRFITLGTVFALTSYIGLLLSSLEEVSEEMQDFQSASACVRRINELLSRQSRIVHFPQEGKTLPSTALSVQFSDVHFTYDQRSSSLRNVSFELQPGQTLGLLGRTGSGKTTLTRLLLRLYDVTDGSISVGGVDIRELSLDELQRHVGIVTQEVKLFHASLRDNVTLFHPDVKDERIIDALVQIGLGQWYQSLPDGLDTYLEPGKTGASAGQEQLIALARVFLKDPGLVILDEALSHLDMATEWLVQQAIHKLLEKRTAIIIAHRLQTVQDVDAILILADGNVLEYGYREALAQDQTSYYAQLKRAGKDEVFA